MGSTLHFYNSNDRQNKIKLLNIVRKGINFQFVKDILANLCDDISKSTVILTAFHPERKP